MANTPGGRCALRGEKNRTPGGGVRWLTPWGGVPRYARKKTAPLGGRSALRAEKNRIPGGGVPRFARKKTGPLGGRSALRAEKTLKLGFWLGRGCLYGCFGCCDGCFGCFVWLTNPQN